MLCALLTRWRCWADGLVNFGPVAGAGLVDGSHPKLVRLPLRQSPHRELSAGHGQVRRPVQTLQLTPGQVQVRCPVESTVNSGSRAG